MRVTISTKHDSFHWKKIASAFFPLWICVFAFECEFKFPIPCSSSEAMLNLQEKFLCLYVNAADFSSRAAGAALPGEHPHSAGILRTGRKRGVSLQPQTIKQLVFLGCRHCAQNLGPQVGANLKQTCFNQKLKNNRKKKKKNKNPFQKANPPPTTKAISSDAGRKNEERAQYLPTLVARPILPLVSGLVDVCLFDFAPGWSNLLVLHVGAVVFALPCG